jgi:hypothetical protein
MLDSMRSFTQAKIPEDFAFSIITYLRGWEGNQILRVSPSDELYGKYGIVDEDLDDFVLAIAAQNGRQLPSDASYWQQPITTIQDVFEFVMSFPEEKDVASD